MVDKQPVLILNLEIINVIELNRFIEFLSLTGIKYTKAIDRYVEFLKIIHQLAKDINVLPDQIELFLFMFGNNLKDITKY